MNKNFTALFLKDLEKHKDEVFAQWVAKILNICPGGYGDGDVLLGLRVPQIRVIAKKYWKNINLKEVERLLRHEIHEVRLASLMILVEKYAKAIDVDKYDIAKIYLNNSKYINNWDLVDLSAPNILGHFWYSGASLTDFWKHARSGNIWKERIAMVSTFYFIKQNRFAETLELAKMFLTNEYDLIHKASGWMLREVGKRDIKTLITFLDKYSHVMPRTMLRYSIEKFPEEQRKFYLEKSSHSL
jgi:3-methyladenine DNA glycosylase AlkD